MSKDRRTPGFIEQSRAAVGAGLEHASNAASSWWEQPQGNAAAAAELAPEAESEPSAAAAVHEVAVGETLGTIADQHTGDVRRYRELFEANTDVISDPNRVEVGAVLALPASWSPQPEKAAPASANGAAEAGHANEAAEEAESALPSDIAGRVAAWVWGTEEPTREQLVEAARQLPGGSTLLDSLNDVAERLTGRASVAEIDERGRGNRAQDNVGRAAQGLDGVGGDTNGDTEGGAVEEKTPEGTIKSGAEWRAMAGDRGWQNSTDIADLDPSWGSKLSTFVDGLRENGASVTINAGLRHPKRACLMHYAWKVSHGQCSPAEANSACAAQGINIDWDHGTPEASQAAAAALRDVFGLVACASLTSNHISGRAVDMNITDVPDELEINGVTYQAGPKADGKADEAKVAHIGKELGVIWYGSGDYVHWSHTGR